MELPQPHSFGTQGRKPTHDFLSLYSPAQQDPTLTSPGGYLKTHDFLQPLERLGKNVGKGDEITSAGKSLRPSRTAANILPGGIGTYSINRMPYTNQSKMLIKPKGVVITTAQSSSSDRNEENSNCGSYNGFALWEEESSGNKGKTGKENNNNQSFVDMLKSAKTSQEDKDDDYDEEEEITIKKEPSLHHKGFMSVKVETDPDQKPSTLRSKHSATEQRRRSKINDRFSMLREIIPHGDQKRDKASFLLEVIEYIQFLQEKVQKYEYSYRGWNNEPTKRIPLKSERQTEGFTDQPRLSSDNVKEEEPTIENDRISISSIYSQGLLSSLTQSLQNSGVELSQASISVQIDLGKTSLKREVSCMDHSLGRSRLASDQEKESDNAASKRLKTTSGNV